MELLLIALAEAQTQQERDILTLGIAALLDMEAEKPRCAWCLFENGQAMGEGSHGICPRHAKALRAQRCARKAA